MDDYGCDGKLAQILELLGKEITDDILERIVNAQEKFHHGCPSSNVDSGLSRKYSAENVTAGVGQEVTAGATENTNWGSVDNAESVKKLTAAEKQAAKKRAAEEKREMQLANKIYRPGECMKHMTVELHPALSAAWFAADVAREVSTAGARLCVSSALCCPALLLWSRDKAPVLTATNGMLELAPTEHKCERALYIATAEEVAELVAARSLSQNIDRMRELSGCKVTLVVFGVQDYFRPSGRKRTNNHRQQMTELELEMAITDLLVTADSDTLKVDTPNELALTIVHFTKAIAEAPYKQAKRQCDEQAQFYMRGDNKNCVAVNKNGAGCGKLWQQMLATLPLSGLERARALCARYPAPRRLYQELLTPSGVETIANIGVSRSAVPGSVARRTGIEFARKLEIIFTAEDGDTLVQ